jgi:hypothetical protein
MKAYARFLRRVYQLRNIKLDSTSVCGGCTSEGNLNMETQVFALGYQLRNLKLENTDFMVGVPVEGTQT